MSKVTFQSALSEVKNRLDILSVISRHLTVKRSGNSYVAICPFHNDKSPSMHISPQKGIFKCFACGASGDLFKFLMDYKKIGFSEAVHELAKECGLEIMQRETSPELSAEQELIFKINEFACKFFMANLHHPDAGAETLYYLQNNRKLNPQTIQSFGLGLSLNAKSALLAHLQSFKELEPQINDPQFLIRCGLFIEDKRDGRPIDRFRGRLMIPIKDLQGRTVAFGARTQDPDLQPKYLNSPETPIYHKSHHLFGWNIAQNYTKTQRQVLLLEGYFDVIQAHQNGVDYAVGSLGTALTREQAGILYGSNLSRKIILGFDMDEAGSRATASALQVFQEGKFSQKPDLRILNLPDCKDIDEFLLKHGRSKLEGLLQNSQNAYRFLIDRRAANTDMQDATQRSNALNDLADLIKNIKDPIDKEILAEECARTLGFSKATVMQLLGNERNYTKPSTNGNTAKKFSSSFPQRAKRRTLPPKPKSNNAEKELVALLLLVSNQEVIEKIKEAKLKDLSVAALRDELLELPIDLRLTLIDQEEPERFDELIAIALWNREKCLVSLLEECMGKLETNYSAVKRLSNLKRRNLS
jgi:DNA primase